MTIISQLRLAWQEERRSAAAVLHEREAARARHAAASLQHLQGLHSNARAVVAVVDMPAVREDHAAAEDGDGHAIALMQLLQLHLARPLAAAVPARVPHSYSVSQSTLHTRACTAPSS